MSKRICFCDMELSVAVHGCVLVHSITEKNSRNGSPFCNLLISDGEEKVNALVFNAYAADIQAEIGDMSGLLQVELVKTLYNGGISYKIPSYETYKGNCVVADFVVHAPVDSDVMYDFILSACDKVSQCACGNLSKIVRALYEKFEHKLVHWSAAKSMHHAYVGGLLYHTYRMFRSGIALLPVYPCVDAELLLCGIALHDIGKLVEFDTDAIGNVTYTTDGNLFGHLNMGSTLVCDTAQTLLDEDVYNTVYEEFPKLRELQHMILSHHGHQEWGAVVKPATLEAYLIFTLDYMDTRMEQYKRMVDELDKDTCSGSCGLLDGAHLYRSNREVDSSFYDDFAAEFAGGVCDYV